MSKSQISIKNTDVLNDSAIVFRDVINHFTVEGVKNFIDYHVTIHGGMISLIGGNKFIARDFKANEIKIQIYSPSGKPSKKIYTRLFRVEEAGHPSVQLMEEPDKIFSNGDTVNQTRLEVFLSNPNYKGDWEVAHFEISLRDSSGTTVLPTTFVSGKYLGKPIYDKIIALSAGSKILFTQVILSYPYGGYRKYDDFTLTRK